MDDMLGFNLEGENGEVCSLCACPYVGAAAWCAPSEEIGAFGGRFKAWWRRITHKEGAKSALRTYAKTAVRAVAASGVLGPAATLALGALAGQMDAVSEEEGDDSVAVITAVPETPEEASELLDRASQAWEEAGIGSASH